MVTFNVPWVETSSGEALQEGSEPITLSAPGAKSISFGVYAVNSKAPLIIGQSPKGVHDSITLVLKRSDRSLKGRAVLKITAILPNNTSQGFEKEFQVI